MADPIVGIDLGTTNSVIALCDPQGQPRVLADERGTKVHPSVVSFHPNGSVVVGVDAKQRRIIDGRNTVYSAKRLIGRSFRSREIQATMQRVSYVVKEGQNQQPVIVTRGGEFAVPEISAIVLDYVRNVAKKVTGQDVARAVVTVPASFTDAQRSATATAGAIAGITVVRVLNEPTAAALAYGHQRQLSRVIAVYDFGGGTFDVTLLRLQDQVYEVLATAGDSFLGGDDIDEVLMEHMADEFLAQHRVDVRQNEVGVMRLRAVAEQTKIELSRRTRAIVKVDEIAYGPGGAPINLQTEISREQLVARATPSIERTFAVCEEALRLAGLSAESIEDVVLVGGTTKIPYVRERVTQFFQRAPRTDVNPEEAVAIGAALQASALERILARKPTSRMPSTPGVPAAPQVAMDEAAGSGQRQTAPMGASMRPPGTRQTTERPVARGEAVDRFDEPDPTPGTGTKALGRITNRGAAAPPPVPGRAGPAARTMIGIPVTTADSEPDEPTLTEREEITHERLPSDATRPGAYDPYAPAAQPTLTFPDRGPLGVPGPAPAGAAIAIQPTLIDAAGVGPSQMPTIMGAAAPPLFGPPPAAGPEVLDVIPRSLGIGTVSGYCEELIRRNARVPTEMRRMFSTSRDQQSTVRIRVCQGESRRIDDNVILGDLVLEGLPPRPRGKTSIEVTFQIDASGRLQVRARDAETGQEQRASLDLLGAQSQEEVDAARARFAGLRR